MKEGMFKELVESSGDIIIVTDKDYRIRYISSSVKFVFDLEAVSLLGRNIFDFLSHDRKEQWLRCVDQKTQLSGEEAIEKKNGEIVYLSIHVSNFLNQFPVEGLVLKLQNITEKKQRENDLLKSNRQLDQIIFKTTHDLKAPLMSAIGLVNIAENASPEEYGKYMKLVRKSLLNLDSLIEEMNDFFRNDKMDVQREEIDIASVVEFEVGKLKNLADESGISIVSEIHRHTGLYSDPVRIKTIIANILSNAIKYYDHQKNRSFVKISVLVNRDICLLELEDNGIGIQDEHLDKIFDLFFRGTGQSQGTGLGLFIVKDTVEKLKGKIEVKSEVGRGTTFTIAIPNQIHQPETADYRKTHGVAKFL